MNLQYTYFKLNALGFMAIMLGGLLNTRVLYVIWSIHYIVNSLDKIEVLAFIENPI